MVPAKRDRAAPRRPPAATSSCSATLMPPSSSSSSPPYARGAPRTVTGEDARRALVVALAVHRVGHDRPHAHTLTGVAPRPERAPDARFHPGRLRRDGLHRPAGRRAGAAHPRARLRRSRSGTGHITTSTPSLATGAPFSSMTGYVSGDLIDPDGADELLATAGGRIEVAAAARHPAAQPARHRPRRPGLPVKPVDGGHRRDVADRRSETLAGSPSWASGTA